MYFGSIEDEKIFEIIVSQWETLTEIVDILEVVNDATIDIQTSHFTLADFFCCWIRINVRLTRYKSKPNPQTDLANLLLENLNIRKCGLLKHPAMLCAIYLDQRVYKELNESEIQIAKITLANLHERICKLKSNANQVITEDSFNDSLEEYFNQQKRSSSDSRAKFMERLDLFHSSLQYEKQKTSSNFWETKKIVFPDLYEVACVINSIPPSQATIERAFSTLNFIFGEKRTLLNQSILENILTIKLNAELSASINQRDIDAIRQSHSV